MSIHIVIDGYNLIRQSHSLQQHEMKSLEDGRHALLDALAAYRRYKRHPITVVFDGADAPLLVDQRGRWKGIDVLFSRRGETADHVIKQIARKRREQIVVVTSDKDLGAFVTRQGSAVIASIDFEKKMFLATEMGTAGIAPEGESRGWTPTTKKKGPARRRSKRERRRRIKTMKL